MEADKQIEEVVAATKAFAQSLNENSKVVGNMSSLVDVTTTISLSKLDFWERLIREEYSRNIRKPVQSVWKVWSSPTERITWLDIFNWDGYRREKALRALSAGAPNSFFLALALRRLNDWVPAVRCAARDQLPGIVRKSDPDHVAEAICATFAHWSSWGRAKDSDKQAMLNLINGQQLVLALKNKLIDSTSGPMTSLLSQFGRTTQFDEYLLEIAEQAVQPAVRAKAYKCLLERKMVWLEGRKWVWTDKRYCIGRLQAVVGERELKVAVPIKELIERGIDDRSAMVRRLSADNLIKHIEIFGNDADVFANELAMDTSSTVSERGEFALKKLHATAGRNNEN